MEKQAATREAPPLYESTSYLLLSCVYAAANSNPLTGVSTLFYRVSRAFMWVLFVVRTQTQVTECPCRPTSPWAA